MHPRFMVFIRDLDDLFQTLRKEEARMIMRSPCRPDLMIRKLRQDFFDDFFILFYKLWIAF